jgi:hypothetical protein
MGNKPQISVAPSALADLAHKSASYQLLLHNPEINRLVAILEKRLEPLIKAAKIMQEKIARFFGKVKPLLRKYLLFIHQELQNILPVIVEKIFYRLLLLPNSYRSHSPPFYSVIK